MTPTHEAAHLETRLDHATTRLISLFEQSRIDRFTDSHRITLSLKAFIAPGRRRFAGAITDIIHDHFLTRHWTDHATIPLAEFTAACDAALREHAAVLPPELRDTLEERIAADWLAIGAFASSR